MMILFMIMQEDSQTFAAPGADRLKITTTLAKEKFNRFQ